MDGTIRHFNQYSTQSQQQWQGLHSNRFPKSRLMHATRDVIKSGLQFPQQTFYSGKKHHEQMRSSQYVFKPRLRQYRNLEHWHPRESAKKILQLQFSQPHPRREKSHFNDPVYEHAQKFAGIRTIYNSRIKDGQQQYTVEDRMQRKSRMNLIELRRGSFKNQSLAMSVNFQKLKF